MSDLVFPFGRPVLPMAPSASEPRRVLVLGAYPSALHVRWSSPDGGTRIAAIPVDNEPTPFWTGDDQEARVVQWQHDVGFTPAWGAVEAVGKLNGSSGAWVENKVLGRLAITRDQAWITDCLDTYRMSSDVAQAFADRFVPWATNAGAPLPILAAHPSESEIVREALADHRDRLVGEITTARPEVIVTLGNAALRVLKELLDVSAAPAKLDAKDYGKPISLTLGSGAATWYPLAHPAAPAAYQNAHESWRPIP